MRAAVLAVALAACRYEAEFPCTQASQCRLGDDPGTCEQAGWCSVRDMECASGRRFDETAGDGLGGTCVPGPDGCEGWTSRYFPACALPAPSGNLTFNGFYAYDTTEGTLTDLVTMTPIPLPSMVIDGVRYISVQDVMVSATSTVRFGGDYPIVIAAWGSMMIAGKLDAGGRTMTGPGSGPPECSATAFRRA
jgi:hypothetical protein